jgi:predicted transcriptional regulator
MDGVLMSIKPEYVAAIVNGEKTVELRRKRPSFAPGTTVIVYSSAPSQRVEVSFKTGEVHEAAPAALWRKVSKIAGVSKQAFDDYFNGCDIAYAIEVESVRKLRPHDLPMRPPQSYMFLRGAERLHRDILDAAA